MRLEEEVAAVFLYMASGEVLLLLFVFMHALMNSAAGNLASGGPSMPQAISANQQ